MSEKMVNKEVSLEELIERQERLIASYDEVKKELATRRKTLDTLKRRSKLREKNSIFTI